MYCRPIHGTTQIKVNGISISFLPHVNTTPALFPTPIYTPSLSPIYTSRLSLRFLHLTTFTFLSFFPHHHHPLPPTNFLLSDYISLHFYHKTLQTSHGEEMSSSGTLTPEGNSPLFCSTGPPSPVEGLFSRETGRPITIGPAPIYRAFVYDFSVDPIPTLKFASLVFLSLRCLVYFLPQDWIHSCL